MNTELYKQLVAAQRKHAVSRRKFAEMCGVSHGTFIDFFNVKKPFRPLSDRTMAKIHNAFGISYEVMEDYNNTIREERRSQKERGE